MPKLSLCMIIKPDDQEAKLLDRALSYAAPHVDEICITQAGKEPNKKVSEVIEKYGGKESFFEWIHDFSAARNFNFSQATGDYIFWLDADDILKGQENLKTIVEKMDEKGVDAVVMNYLYDFTREGKNRICTVKHLKTRIVKKDVVEWVGEVHEDFAPKRALSSMFVEEIEVLHITDDERAEQSSKRNIEIAKKFKKENPDDPRGEWLVANALMGEKKEEEASEYFREFIKRSNSDEEIFIAFLRLGDIEQSLTDYLQALALRPDYPDAYLKIGELYFNKKEYELARRFLLVGLQVRTPDREIVVYNPRDYDFNPLMILAQIYIQQKEYTKAIVVLERCVKIMPEHEQAKSSLKLIKKYKETEKKVDEVLEKAQKIKDKKKLEEFIEGVDYNIKSHPKMSVFRNLHFTKTESSGKDIAYYCGYTEFQWHPEGKKLGGSEEAVVNLSKQWAGAGYNVTVYNNCGSTIKEYDGVTYKPYWMYNPKDVYDYMIIWRHPKPLDFKHNSKKFYVDVHDVLPEGEFTKDRLDKLEKIFLKTRAHRVLFPNIPDHKIAVIPNGLDPEPLKQNLKKDPYLILNTSSPDRHIDATLEVFERLIEKSDKPWKLAWYYGWDNYLSWNKDNKPLMEYYKENDKRFKELVKKGKAEGGTMISQDEIAKKYLQAGVFLYPTQFYEIHCISASKAQMAGCYPITSDFAALDETVQYGIKIPTSGKKWKTSATFGDTENIDRYVEAIINLSDEREMEIAGEQQWAEKTYNWSKISNQWLSEM